MREKVRMREKVMMMTTTMMMMIRKMNLKVETAKVTREMSAMT